MEDTVSTKSLESQGTSLKARALLLIFHNDRTIVAHLGGFPCVVGRDPDANVTIDDESLSRTHANFELREGDVWVTDLGSTNGTLVNGVAKERCRLNIWDEVRMGNVAASIHLLTTGAPQKSVPSHERFLEVLRKEATRAAHFGRSVVLAMIEADLAPDELLELARPRLRPVDHLSLFSPNTLELLMPEMRVEAAQQFFAELTGALETPTRSGLSVYPDSGTTAEMLFEACRQALHAVTPEQPIAVAPSRQSSWAVAEPGGVEPVVRSPAMIELLQTVEQLATAMIPVLLVGETGSGKEVVARALHQKSSRRHRPMACINCGAIPATLTESVLFGHERGAFTGATRQATGIFEQADGGMVLLDEVGELSPSAQVALLRVLETKSIRRVGSSKEITVDVRVLAATHRDLEAMCQQGEFREDLFYRLNGVTLRVPPLRERLEEIGALVQLFIREANAANGLAVMGIEDRVLRQLHLYAWPGNIRELRNAIERAVVVARGCRISMEDLPELVRSSKARDKVQEGRLRDEEDLDFRQRLAQHEATLIVKALEASDGNRQQAAQMLNVPLRTLARRISALGIRSKGYGLKE